MSAALPATEPAEEGPPEAASAQPGRRGLAAYLDLDRKDLLAVGTLLLVAFGFRFFSPLMPDFFQYGFSKAPISNCVQHTPVDPKGTSGTLCGLAYPFQRGYPANSANPQPPNGQVFDEIYFATFAHDDLKGISYFDPEPPLSKLIIAAGEWGWGWWRQTFQGAQGNPADLGYNTFGWRIMSCIFGTLVVGMMYLVARALWPANRFFAVAAGTLACFDGMFFIQSRIGMIDIFPIFFILSAYWLFLIHLRSRGRSDSLLTLMLVGLVISLAIASKWISLAAWGTIIFFLAARFVRRKLDISIDTGSRVFKWGRGEVEGPAIPGAVPLGTYLGVAAVALIALPLVIYVASWIPFFERGQFHSLGDLWKYQVDTYVYHATLTATHPYGSPWWSWPFLKRPVAYYYESQGLGLDRVTGLPLVAGMVNLGNPLIWWSSLPCLAALVYYLIKERSFPAALILVAFTTQYLPWARITRVIFLYHMFGGLPWMLMALAFVLARFSRFELFKVQHDDGTQTPVTGRWLAYGYLAVAICFFLYFYPVWTGLPISNSAYLNGFTEGGKMWFTSWI